MSAYHSPVMEANSMTTISKPCTKCKTPKPLTSFYMRSGFTDPDEPGHRLSECIDCMRQRNYDEPCVHPTEPRAPTEVLVIDYLKAHGVSCLPGKAVHAAHVDVVAWGCVNIEVKYARYEPQYGSKLGFKFTITPKQRERGFLAHVVVLVCDYGLPGLSFHLFPSKFIAFYKEGRLKKGFDYIPGRDKPEKQLYPGIEVLTDLDMDTARDRLELIERARIKVGDALRG